MAAPPRHETCDLVVGDFIEWFVLPEVGHESFEISPRLLAANMMLANLGPVSPSRLINRQVIHTLAASFKRLLRPLTFGPL
jgi:hypothetical protein